MFKRLKLSEVGQIVSGGTPKTKVEEYWNGDIPWITPKDLSSHLSMFISRGERNISKDGLNNSSAKLLPKGTVLFTSRAPIGYVAIAENNVTTNQGFKSIVVNSENHNVFIYYLLKNNVNYIENYANGSTFKEISGSIMKNLEFDVPSLQEQKAIAHILSTLDEKIEVNNQINKTLEEMAQTIFKRWFVDFEFPNKDGEPYKSTGGEMVESELGLIPKGWEVQHIGNIIELYDSKRIPLSKNEREKREKIYPYYGAASLMDYVDDYIFDGTYVLMGEDGTVVDENGFPILQYVWGKFWVNNHAHVIKGKDNYSQEFILILLKNTNISSIVTGAVQPKINQQNLKGLKIILPRDFSLIELFTNLFKESYAEIRNNIDENRRLSTIRDLLLPKLMSGEIRVPLVKEEVS